MNFFKNFLKGFSGKRFAYTGIVAIVFGFLWYSDFLFGGAWELWSAESGFPEPSLLALLAVIITTLLNVLLIERLSSFLGKPAVVVLFITAVAGMTTQSLFFGTPSTVFLIDLGYFVGLYVIIVAMTDFLKKKKI